MLHTLKNSSLESLASQLAQSLAPPAIITVVSDLHTPVSAFHRLTAGCPTAFLFESSEGDSRLARYSFVGLDPLLTVVMRDGVATCTAKSEKTSFQFGDPAAFLSQLMQQFSDLRLNAAAASLKELPFTGGLVGYMGYGATRYFEGITPQASDPLAVPDAVFGLFDSVVVFDHQRRLLHVISRRGDNYAHDVLHRLQRGSALPVLSTANLPADEEVFAACQSNLPQARFLELVDICQDYIRQGQVFQIVLSHRFSLEMQAESLDFYRLLQSINPSPYAYFLKLPGFEYLGSSPETFIACRENRVTLRAIAGTRPRGGNDQEDERLAVELKHNEKELAEHHMLVDLARNDLGRISSVGTVQVGEIATLTKYAHVMHLSTEVTGLLNSGKTCFDAFRSCFPRGTVSGAPKIRAMQLLSHLEPDQRGIYSGFVGYFDFAGNMDGAIAIRSALVKDGRAHISAGAGIVLDSKPEDEYEETRNKARSVVKAAVAANAARRQES
jgi:anthranilate synthase component 1